ncbi:thiamine pyrophosphokinase [Tissierella praeacuta DSM 18095]|uniref:Thiamine diphosphokinase n=1 Tax=Tissierella praeacuta DSM 18095 TaxID=1123404 RepID=A0A1M4SQ67_9FIRM|nr:thiamine diphosphokinase [Tissierella praeacuta]TCU70636.1 thiamine pyrophosphokinase [Tissierella praeacuta]SHE34322.1 thiamine pyrophosphokinase [Tissierella praeacuta DSM 18095]SUP01646.1 Thiamine pyrophosphokinase [Tissierella praeacuta]
MKGLIVSSGTITDYNRLESVVKEVDFIICADGGMNHLMKINRNPDLVIGDLDSISQVSLDYIKYNNIPIKKYPSIKDETDTEIAMKYLIDRGYKEIILTGVTGTRQDHTMANIFLLNTLYDKGINGKIVDDNNIIYLTDDYLELPCLKNSYVSIIPIVEDGIVISLKGFFYNLDNEFIKFGSTYGISNEIVDNTGIIKIHRGKALVFISKD